MPLEAIDLFEDLFTYGGSTHNHVSQSVKINKHYPSSSNSDEVRAEVKAYARACLMYSIGETFDKLVIWLVRQ